MAGCVLGRTPDSKLSDSTKVWIELLENPIVPLSLFLFSESAFYSQDVSNLPKETAVREGNDVSKSLGRLPVSTRLDPQQTSSRLHL